MQIYTYIRSTPLPNTISVLLPMSSCDAECEKSLEIPDCRFFSYKCCVFRKTTHPPSTKPNPIKTPNTHPTAAFSGPFVSTRPVQSQILRVPFPKFEPLQFDVKSARFHYCWFNGSLACTISYTFFKWPNINLWKYVSLICVSMH